MVGKANWKIGMLKRTFKSREPGLWKCGLSLVMPHFEYAVQAWNSHLQGDIDKIERVQRRASRIRTCNSLPNNIVSFPSVKSFKSSIDEHFKRFSKCSEISISCL